MLDLPSEKSETLPAVKIYELVLMKHEKKNVHLVHEMKNPDLGAIILPYEYDPSEEKGTYSSKGNHLNRNG